MARERIETLDAIRGACAIVVMLMHGEYLTGINLAPSAYLAVDMFFLMSGFVVAKAYDSRLRSNNFMASFLLRRVARLWPMWLLGLSIGALTPLLLTHGRSYGDWLLIYGAGLLLAPTLVRDHIFPFNPPGWSLFLEMVINILYGLFARYLSSKTLGVLIVPAIVALIAAAFNHGSLYGGQEAASFYVGVARVAFSFPLGVLIYRSSARRVAMPPVLFLVAFAILIGTFFVPSSGAWTPAYDSVTVILVYPCIFSVAIRTKLRSTRLAETLGELSYPLYTIHFAVMLSAMNLRGVVSGWTAHLMSLPAASALMGTTLVVAWFLGHHVDPVIQRRLAPWLRQRPVGVPLAAG